ncbi:MAG: ROK family protein [Nanoarchaeota archaeon]|nr:ROK family protein [Nanoarchaeota archaeon]
MTLLGIDIGGTTIKAGMVTGLEVKEKVEVPTPKTQKEIVRALRTIISFAHADAVGIGCPGVIEGTRVTFCPNLPLSGFDFKELGNVVVHNDAACAAWAEAYARKTQNLVCLTLGTGVGSGMVLDGVLRPAEAGHMTIDYKGKKSNCCWNDGCLESLLKMNLEHAKKEEMDTFGKLLGIGVANLVNLLHPEIVVLVGGKSKAFSAFQKPMLAEIKKRALFPVKVEQSKLEDAGIVGAALLAD